jgi:hypothetical protein
MKILTATRKTLSFGLLLAVFGCMLLLTACGESTQTSAAASSSTPAANGASSDLKMETLAYRSPQAQSNRTVTRTPVSQVDAATALQTWASQKVGVNLSLSEAKGMTSQVIADYDIPTQQRGVIEANIAADRAAYAGKVQGGGFTTLILGGGSTVSNDELSVKINSASLGYLQLPATSYPTSSEAALAQLKQAFPALSGYNFTLRESPNNNQHAYTFYSQTSARNKGNVERTGVVMGVVQVNGKIWVYALVGTGNFAPETR